MLFVVKSGIACANTAGTTCVFGFRNTAFLTISAVFAKFAVYASRYAAVRTYMVLEITVFHAHTAIAAPFFGVGNTTVHTESANIAELFARAREIGLTVRT